MQETFKVHDYCLIIELVPYNKSHFFDLVWGEWEGEAHNISSADGQTDRQLPQLLSTCHCHASATIPTLTQDCRETLLNQCVTS